MERPLRVLMVTTHFHPDVGGTERQAHGLARELLKRGHLVRVGTHRPRGLRAFETVDGVPVYRVIRPFGRGAVYAGSYVASLIRLLIQWRSHYDVIHAHLLFLDAVAAGWMRARLKKPVIGKAACGGSFGDVARLQRLPFRGAFVSALRNLDRMVAPSRQVEAELCAFGFSLERIVRIPNGVDLSQFAPASDRDAVRRALRVRGRVVCCVGRLDPQKGLAVLVEAWRRVVAAFPDVHLWLIGKGPQEHELRRVAERLGLADRVWFGGGQPDVRSYLQAADIFVLPSLAEGMSNALLEAMACGLPCVATRIGGNEELITDRVNGVLVAAGDSNALADAIIRLFNDSAMAARMGRQTRQTVEQHYDLHAIADRYLTVYEDVLRHANGHA